MQENQPESSFRPQSPLSLYSYVDPQAKVQSEAKKVSVSGEEVVAKSILKSTKAVPQQVQQIPAQRAKTPVNTQPRLSLERRKTVAFGRTVPISQTIEVG